MSKRHVVDLLTEERKVVSLSGLDIGSLIEVEALDARILPEVLRGELVDVKHGRGVLSVIGIKRADGRWIWRHVQPSTVVRFEQS